MSSRPLIRPAIRVEHLGKRYTIPARRPSTQPMLRDVLADAGRNVVGRLVALLRPGSVGRSSRQTHVWALRDVSFEVPHGQILGIVGRNGAGKSTLLKILSRITDPTEGRVEIGGRVASLLEVGTGFHPELTGRENVYLSGTLLGMKKAEIDRKLDEIIDFSGVATFIETPVKHYSSGMYVRLAFAVAAHLDPDVLIIDEVLAVGDIAFQRKCLAKMEDVRQHGRTVLFVSHNMTAVSRLCQRAILISDGSVQKDGPVGEVVSTYLASSLNMTAKRVWRDPSTAPGSEVARLRGVRVRTEEGSTAEIIDVRRSVGIEMIFDVIQPGHVLVPAISLYTDSTIVVFSALDLDPEWRGRARPIGRFTSTAWVPANLLSEGTLLVSVALGTHDPPVSHFRQRDAVAFQTMDTIEGDSARGNWDGELQGVVRPLLKWTTEFHPQNAELDSNLLP
jgi:lipopolysaccharide transport system ATP-binding protein